MLFALKFLTVTYVEDDNVFCFPLNALATALDTGLLASDVFVTLPRPTIAAVMPVTVPVKVGLLIGAFVASSFATAVDTGLLASDVFVTLPRPTIALVMPGNGALECGVVLGSL